MDYCIEKRCERGCSSMGQRGNGTSRGTCLENHLCGGNGKCLKACTIQGKPGNGHLRGSCPEYFVCFSSGECRKDAKLNGVETTSNVFSKGTTTVMNDGSRPVE